MSEQITSKPWYKKWWGIILTIALFPLVVPYLVWTKTTWNKWAKIAITTVCVIIVISSMVDSNQKNQIEATKEQLKTNNDEELSGTKNEDSSKYINGLTPVDVYLNMEKQDFKTEKQLGGEYGNSWTSTKSYAGIDYKVETYSSNINNVESVRGTVMVDVTQKEIIAAQQFFIFLSSLPYDNADPQKASQWVKDNYNNDKSTTIIGDAKFTIYAPSVAVRMMIIEKAK